MEVERLIFKLRNRAMLLEDQFVELFDQESFDLLTTCAIHVNKGRTVATVAKMLVDKGEEQLAGVLVQILGSGVPYEVCDE